MKYFLKIIFISIFILLCFDIYGQNNPTISEFDDESIRSFNIPDLLKSFETALNVISYSGSEPLDFKVIKDRLLYNSVIPRTFFDEKVIVESDLHSDAVLSYTKEDLSIKNYLESFDVLYPKTQSPSISFTIVKISALKKGSYFYYKVLFESVFKNKYNNGNKFKSVKRIAEIRLEHDTIWNAYIGGIQFAPKNYNPDDNRNNFRAFVADYSRSTDSKIEKLMKKKEQEMAAQKKSNQIISEGDNYFIQEKNSEALASYKLALSMDPYDDATKGKVEKCEAILENKRIEKKKNEISLKNADLLKQRMINDFNNYDFESCRHIHDSLIIYYNQKNDSDLIVIGKKLSVLIPFIENTRSLERMEEYEAMLQLSVNLVKSKTKIGVNEDSLLIAEGLYRSARALYLIDSTLYKQISAYCEEALHVSKKAHMPCKILLIHSQLLNKSHSFQALEIATTMVENDPSNPEPRIIRAYVYEHLNNPEKAIKEYQLVIDLKTEDSTVYINKARLEYYIHNYSNSISTATSGLNIFPCNQSLYYYRILSKERLGDYIEAGKDYKKACSCGIYGFQKDTIINRGINYYETGLSFFDLKQLDSALSYFNMSYELSQNLDGLFFRGYTYMLTGKNSQALEDLNKLILLDSTFKHAFYMRGLINANGKNYYSSISDFKKQINLIPEYWKSYALCGKSLFNLERYGEAADFFIEANKYKYTDTVATFAVESHFRNKEYQKAIDKAVEYIESKKSEYGSLYKYKGLSEFKLGYFLAAERDLSFALRKDPNDYEANLWILKNYIALGKSSKASLYTDRIIHVCDNCPETLLWTGISIIARQEIWGNENGIKKILMAIDKDSTLNSAANLAWIAYGYLLSNDVPRFYSTIQNAEIKETEDPIVLFVKTCAWAKMESDNKITLNMLEQACSKGFIFKHLVDNDPALQKVKYENRYKSVLQNCFGE